MSVKLHEAPKTGDEIRAGYRLADREKLAASPIPQLALARASALTEQGQYALVGISTRDAVAGGADPTVCIVINPSRHGEFLNPHHPERWDYRRVDLVAQSIGDNPLRVAVKGRESKHVEPGMPHKITDMWEIESALDDALKNPRSESTEVTPQLKGFPVRGFETVVSSKA